MGVSAVTAPEDARDLKPQMENGEAIARTTMFGLGTFPMHNPKTDPRPGDSLEKGLWRRDVLGRGKYFAFGGRDAVKYRGRNGAIRYCLLAGWKRWAKDAEVVSPAEDAAK
jgi:hypothetical protein